MLGVFETGPVRDMVLERVSVLEMVLLVVRVIESVRVPEIL